jgi:hypothetical protein
MDHRNQHHKVGLIAALSIAILVGLAGRRACAQSIDDWSAHSTESATIDATDVPAVSDDASSADGNDDSVAHPAADSPKVESVPAVSAEASDPASSSPSEDGAVLEIPQVVDLQNGPAVNQPAEGASANADGSNADSAQSSQDGHAGDDFGVTADQVGTLQDYQSQQGAVPFGPIFFPPGVTIVRFPRQPLYKSLRQPRFGVPMAAPPIILPPTSSGPFPSTSPMLMAPRMGSLRSFPSAGFTGFRR